MIIIILITDNFNFIISDLSVIPDCVLEARDLRLVNYIKASSLYCDGVVAILV